MHYVYILRCSDDSLYTGYTTNLKARLKAHNQGQAAAFTSKRSPVRLAYSEAHPSRLDAIRRECQLKGWSRQKKEALIRGDLSLLRHLSTRRR